ncbi:MAG: hypothetical protein GY795_34490 [Desulfobacterales bacterium]|nr:hypothetical protein [Desulfobacterales bacterium]
MIITAKKSKIFGLWNIIICFSIVTIIPSFSVAISPDSYEEDNIFTQANIIVPSSDQELQHHNFHEAHDVDWVMFWVAPQEYTIKASNVGIDCNVVVEVYDADGKTSLKGPVNDGWEGEKEEFLWKCKEEGLYLIKVTTITFGDNTKYDMSVFMPSGELPGNINGVVTDAFTEHPIADVHIEVSGSEEKITVKSMDGWVKGNYFPNLYGMYYASGLKADNYNLTAMFDEYETYSGAAEVKQGLSTINDILMNPTIIYSVTKITNQNVTATLNLSEPITITNNNGLQTRVFTENGEFAFEFKHIAGNTGNVTAKVNWIVSVRDIILSLQILTEIDVKSIVTDVKADGKIGMDDIIYKLQKISMMRESDQIKRTE